MGWRGRERGREKESERKREGERGGREGVREGKTFPKTNEDSMFVREGGVSQIPVPSSMLTSGSGRMGSSRSVNGCLHSL